MYKVKNITNGKLFINDLGVKLGSGEIVDLDAKFPRDHTDKSLHLRVAEANEFLAVLHKDVVQPQHGIDPQTLLEMEKRIRQTILSEVENRNQPQPAAPQDITALLSKMDDLMEAVKKQPQASPQVSHHDKPSDEMESSSHADKLVEVHAKVLKRIAQNTSGHVQANESTSDSDMSKHVDELGDLLQ